MSEQEELSELGSNPIHCFTAEDTEGQMESDMSKFTQLLRSMVGTCLQNPDALATGS